MKLFKKLAIVYQDTDYIGIEILVNNEKLLVIFSFNENAPKKAHSLKINGKLWHWEGPYMQRFI